MATSYERGKRAELELARILWRSGFAVMRAPASGARARRIPWPDIVAVKRDGGGCRALVIEVKMRARRNTIYISSARLARLHEYARRMGAEAYIAVKVAEEHRWYIIPISMLERQLVNGEPRYAVTATVYDRALTLEELLAGRQRGSESVNEAKARLELEDTEITE